MSLNVVEVLVCYNDLDAEIAKGILEKNGIEVFVVRDDCGGMEPQLQMTEGIKVLVPYSELKEASLLLKNLANKETGDNILQESESWKCSRCGELLEGQFTDCWNCGASRDEDLT